MVFIMHTSCIHGAETHKEAAYSGQIVSQFCRWDVMLARRSSQADSIAWGEIPLFNAPLQPSWFTATAASLIDFVVVNHSRFP